MIGEMYRECGKGTWQFLKCVTLPNPEDEMAGIMSFASLTDADAVAME